MKTFSRITAIVLIVLGILVLLAGLTTAILGSILSGLHLVQAAQPLRFGGLGVSLAMGIFFFIQGMFITAVGQGLYLLTDMSSKLGPESPH